MEELREGAAQLFWVCGGFGESCYGCYSGWAVRRRDGHHDEEQKKSCEREVNSVTCEGRAEQLP